jgi:hypothetical protein
MDVPTGIGLFLIMYYTFTQMCNFYGINNSEYGLYVTFYLFLFVAIMVLPNTYQLITKPKVNVTQN